MITKASSITVFVKNQLDAKRWYTEVLGFQVISEIEFSPGWSYLTVAPSNGSETVIELSLADTPEKESLIGKQAADLPLVMFISDDIHEDFARLSKRGVDFSNPPKEVPGGLGAGFCDLYGNQFDLYQPGT